MKSDMKYKQYIQEDTAAKRKPKSKPPTFQNTMIRFAASPVCLPGVLTRRLVLWLVASLGARSRASAVVLRCKCDCRFVILRFHCISIADPL
jgi:hypothetical protein